MQLYLLIILIINSLLIAFISIPFILLSLDFFLDKCKNRKNGASNKLCYLCKRDIVEVRSEYDDD